MAGLTRRIPLSNLILTLVMAVFVGVPLAGAVWSHSGGAESRVEKRKLASLPAWPNSFKAWMRFPKAFDTYAHDRFGFRDDLLAGYKWLLVSVFHNSASPSAFIGRHGWLYVTNSGNLKDMQGADPYSDAELQNIVEQINARGELLAVRGIRFGFVVFPDKHTVYPQFLPHGVYAGYARRRLHVLDIAMAQTSHDYYVDISSAMRRDAAHSPFQLYYKSDTHWNWWGAYLGYRAWDAADGARIGLKTFDYRFDQFRNPHHSVSGDLSRMSGYRPYDPEIHAPADAGCQNIEAWTPSLEIRQHARTIPSHLQTSGCDGTGTALVMRDSFMYSMMVYVSASFARTWYVWQQLDDADFGWLVRRLQPDTVVVQRVERLMDHFRRTDLAALTRELGVVGESVAVDDRDRLVLGTGLTPKPRASVPLVTSIDRIIRRGDHVRMDGWAREGDHSPDAVVAVVAGKVVGEAPVTLYRSDVAKSTGNTQLTWSGYSMDVPVGAFVGNPAALRLYFVGFKSYGEYTMSERDRQLLSNVLPGVKQ